MPKVQSGQPNESLYSVSTVSFRETRLTALAVGNAIVIYRGVDDFLQTLRCEQTALSIAIDPRTGKVAAAGIDQIEIFELHNDHGSSLQWRQQMKISTGDQISCLSWGSTDQLLTGSKEIALYSCQNSPMELIWQKLLANPLRMLAFSPDGSLFASIAEYDRVVKIWHRIPTPTSYDFSFVYLSLSCVVVHVQWKQSLYTEEDIENLLFTIDGNNNLVIWAAMNAWEPHILYQRTSIKMDNSEDHLSIASTLHTTFCILVSHSELTRALETVFNRMDGTDDSTSHTLDSVAKIAREGPEICLVLNQAGDKLCVWGIQQADPKSGKPLSTSKILERTLQPGWLSRLSPYSLFWAFCVGSHGVADLFILEHTLNGCVHISEVDILAILAESNSRPIQKHVTRLGHKTQDIALTRTVDGLGLLSKGHSGDSIAWGLDSKGRIRQRCILPFEQTCHSITLLAGRYCLALYPNVLELWSSRSSPPIKLHSLLVTAKGKFLSFFQLPRAVDDGEVRKFIAITDAKESFAWRADFSTVLESEASPGILQVKLASCAPFPSGDDLHFISAVDPMGWHATINSDSLDVYTREVLITVSGCGRLQTWTANLPRQSNTLTWLNISTVPTNIVNPRLAHGTSERKVAMVDNTGNELTIWDTRISRFNVHKEYRKTFPPEDIIKDLDWTSTPDSQSILAVGFPRRVVLFCQQRYDYLNGGSMWISFMSYDMHNLTDYRISDSIWLDEGTLAVAAGAQLYVFDKSLSNLDIRGQHLVDAHNFPLNDIFDVCRRLNGPLPVYHPQFLEQAILAGKLSLVKTLLEKLERLLDGATSGKPTGSKIDTSCIDTFLNTDLSDFLTTSQGPDTGHALSSFNAFQMNSFVGQSPFTEKVPARLKDLVERSSLPYLTSAEQIRLAVIIDCMSEFEHHQRSLDLNASRYFLFFRQHMLSRVARKSSEVQLSLRDMLWAFHSHSQEILLDLVSRTYGKPMKWEQAREAGIFLWTRSPEALKITMEVLARDQYAQTDERNPVDCSLFYLALRKKNVLLGLWRTAGWHKEQSAMLKFLSHDFNDTRWRTAASKNAYALLAKQRYEYAAAFFLLADSLKDAVNVCLRNLGDYQLAVALARVYEGEESPVLFHIINEHVLPKAVEDGDRWLASWGFWMIGDRGKSVQALILPLDELIPSSVPRPSLIHIDDPALIVLYRQMKDKTLQTVQGAAKVSPKLEFDYILRIAALYDRLGCDLLALDLVKNWDFTTEAANATRPVLSSRRRSTIDDISVSKFRQNLQNKEALGIPATVNEESSLLDSFNFGF